MISSIITLLFFMCAQGLNSIHFSVSPPIVEITAQPLSLKKFSLTVSNEYDGELKLSIKVLPLKMSVSGEVIPLEDEGSEWSCHEWIESKEKELKIKPDETRDVPFTIRVPNGITGGRYCVVLFESSSMAVPDEEIELVGCLGTIVMVVSKGVSPPRGSIEELNYYVEDRSVRFRISVKNDGQIHFKTKGSILITNQDNRIIDRINIDVGTGTVLPGSVRIFEAMWSHPEKVRKGEYKMLVRFLIPGSGGYLQKEIAFSI